MREGLGDQESGIAAVGGLDDAVRRRLYEYVSGRGEAVGRDEAAAAVGIGRPLAAYHLDKLVDLGLLTASYQRPEGRRGPGAGRPAKLYARSGREFSVSIPPREYELAARLLAKAVNDDVSGAARATLGQAAHQLGVDLGRVSGGVGDDSRGAETVLAHHGFEPVGDVDGNISLANCPFHKLAGQYPDVVCGMNLALIGGLIDGLGLAGLCPVLEPGTGQCCVVIKKSHRAGIDELERDDARTDSGRR
jgi:predicted ArsR family transcriptional regulator